MKYSIECFWRPRFASVVAQTPPKELLGWCHSVHHVSSFVEASLSLREGFDDLTQSVWMIAAPGAVGKSTLAREICASTQAVYLDLASAATVAGNYLVGGLVNAGLWKAWEDGATTLLIDALDEARLRVTQSSFEDFLLDVVNVAKLRKIPVVLLGRVGIVEEAWIILNEKSEINPPIFDIELFQADRAKEFVISALHRLAAVRDPISKKMVYPHLENALVAHASVYKDAVNFLVEELTKTTSVDGRQFAGYAPVLEAVATVIAAESNPSRINEALKSVLEGRVLGRVTSEVMVREAGKLANQLAVSMPGINTEGLYGPEEQLSRLASLILKAGAPKFPKNLPQHAVAIYESAVQSLLPQHPFLDSKEPKPSGAVFAANIIAAALTGEDMNLARAAERFAGGGPHTPNPFLLDFYLQASGNGKNIPASHVGLLYSSLEATTSAGDSIRLTADGGASLDVEMSVIQPDGVEKSFEFSTAANGTLRFGRRLRGVSIDAEELDIEIGDGGQVELIAPVDVRARALFFNSAELVVKPDHVGAVDQIVFLEAKEVMTESGITPPVVRVGATLQVAWPTSKVFPWTPFASDGGEDSDPRMADAQRALRRLCVSFRSHSKGRLARFKGKVEHFRMTKGALGVALRERLLDDGVLKLEGTMYFLEPDALGLKVGLGFQDLKLKHYPQKSRAYLQEILDDLNK